MNDERHNLMVKSLLLVSIMYYTMICLLPTYNVRCNWCYIHVQQNILY